MANVMYVANLPVRAYVSHSNRKTRRQFRPNVQRVKVMENGHLVSKYMCARCIRTMSKDIV